MGTSLKSFKSFLLAIAILSSTSIHAQDTTQFDFKKEEQLTTIQKRKTLWNKENIIKASIAPALLIGYSLTVIGDNGFYSDYDARRDIQNWTGGDKSGIDDYLIFAPFLELGLLNLANIKCKNDLINLSLLILKSEAIMATIVFSTKAITNRQRPDVYYSTQDDDPTNDLESNGSFPSGHTAHAFLAATIVHNEYKDKHPIYGIAAYTVATSVAAFRMINDRHWQSDVLAGAGVGILSAHLAYLTHQFRWGKNTCFLPMVQPGKSAGFAFIASF